MSGEKISAKNPAAPIKHKFQLVAELIQGRQLLIKVSRLGVHMEFPLYIRDHEDFLNIQNTFAIIKAILNSKDEESLKKEFNPILKEEDQEKKNVA